MLALPQMRLNHTKLFFVVALLLAQMSGATTNALALEPADWPPAAELRYQLKVVQHGFPLSGEAIIRWTLPEESAPATNQMRYQIQSETRVALLGKILSTSSSGDFYQGTLRPEKFTEKRLNKAEVITLFDYATGLIHFGEGIEDVHLQGGEQDRSSVTWQLAALACHAKASWQAGHELSLPVSSRRDVEVWRFKVLGTETLSTALGELPVLHLSKIANKTDADGNANTREQQIDLWFAADLQCYPVKISFTDSNGAHIEQTITQINRIENLGSKP
jgi:hypothetical protein